MKSKVGRWIIGTIGAIFVTVIASVISKILTDNYYAIFRWLWGAICWLWNGVLKVMSYEISVWMISVMVIGTMAICLILHRLSKMCAVKNETENKVNTGNRRPTLIAMEGDMINSPNSELTETQTTCSPLSSSNIILTDKDKNTYDILPPPQRKILNFKFVNRLKMSISPGKIRDIYENKEDFIKGYEGIKRDFVNSGSVTEKDFDDILDMIWMEGAHDLKDN
jgi:hypothetical protein